MDADKDVCSACGQSFNCSYPLESSEARGWVLQALGALHQPDTYVIRVTLSHCHSYHVLSSSSLKFVSNSKILHIKFYQHFSRKSLLDASANLLKIKNKNMHKDVQHCLYTHHPCIMLVEMFPQLDWPPCVSFEDWPVCRRFDRWRYMSEHKPTTKSKELCVELTLERRTFPFCSSPPIRRWRWSSYREATPEQSAWRTLRAREKNSLLRRIEDWTLTEIKWWDRTAVWIVLCYHLW